MTISDVRARVETDLDDDTVQRILDAAVEDMNRHAGSPTADTEVYRGSCSRILSLLRRSTAVASVKERRTLTSEQVTLHTSDWRKSGGYELVRLGNGQNPASTWGAEVEIAYTPEVDAELRDRVILDLCQMDIEFRALQVEVTGGDHTANYGDYADRRRALLAQVREGRSLVV